MNFFGSPSSQNISNSYSGIRGPGWDYANQMSQYLVPTVQNGANAGYSMFTNPNQFLQGGLYADQANLLPTLVNLAGNKFSASGAARGMLSPENNGAIAGSVATALAPNLFSMISDNINNLRTAGGNMFLGSLGTGVSSLGSQNESYGSSNGPGIGYNMANQFFNNAMEGFSAPKMMSSMGGGKGMAALM
jgi:hypothetical protein